MSQVQPKKRRVSLLLGFCNAILAVSTFAVLLLLGSPLFPILVFLIFWVFIAIWYLIMLKRRPRFWEEFEEQLGEIRKEHLEELRRQENKGS